MAHDPIKMFGCDINEFRKSVEESATYQCSGKNMVVMSLMSDAQEEMAHGMYETARQTLNKAKYILITLE